MKITETRMDKFHKKLTDEDILAYAKNIGELKKKINEAEYAKKNLKNLYREMSEITGILEKGEVSRYMAATFTYHYPEENLVTITPEHITDFPAVVRPMTEIEIERHCEHTIEFEEPEESFFGPTENYTPDYVEGNKQGRKQYFILPTKNVSFPWVLWLQEFDEEGKILDNSSVFYGTSREEVVLKLQGLMSDLNRTINDETDQEEETTFPKGWSIEPNSTGKWTVRGSWKDSVQVLGSHPTRVAAEAYLKEYLANEAIERDPIDDEAISPLDQIDNDEYYDPGTFVPEEEEAEEEAEIAQEQPKKSTLLKDIEESMQIREWISKLQIYRNMENREEHYAKINEKYHEAIVNPKNSDDVWKYYIVAGYEKYETKRREDEIVLGFLNKRRNYIRVNNEQQKQEVTTTPEPELNEPQPLSTIHVYKSPTNQYYILDEQLNPIRLKVLNSLENVVFLEQEGVDGVILKRHSEITPGGEIA